jgi:hypothetical protein
MLDNLVLLVVKVVFVRPPDFGFACHFLGTGVAGVEGVDVQRKLDGRVDCPDGRETEEVVPAGALKAEQTHVGVGGGCGAIVRRVPDEWAAAVAAVDGAVTWLKLVEGLE